MIIHSGRLSFPLLSCLLEWTYTNNNIDNCQAIFQTFSVLAFQWNFPVIFRAAIPVDFPDLFRAGVWLDFSCAFRAGVSLKTASQILVVRFFA